MGTSKDSPTYKSSIDSSSIPHSSILYSPTTTSLFINSPKPTLPASSAEDRTSYATVQQQESTYVQALNLLHRQQEPTSSRLVKRANTMCVPMAENHAVIVTVEEEEDPVETPEAEQESSKTNAPSTHDITPSTLPSSITSVQTKWTPPAFTYESKAASPETARRVFKSVLEMTVPNLTISDLLAISPDLRKEAVEYCKVQRVPTPTVSLTTNIVTTPAPLQIEHAVPLRELRVTLNGVHSELGLLDEGSEIVVIREDVWRKTNAPRNQGIHMRMQTANGGAQEMGGCVEMLEIDVDGIKMTTMAKTRSPIQE
ncbi:hypothetical protein EV424DRAFT_1356545 [Suillus variegatus]|nr:hypothetical protein EV424DRAFT_1356545 [Suillus variegatus]